MAIEGAPEGWIKDYSADGFGTHQSIGVILVHGFTGTPASMRPWAHYLNERGYTVSVPLMPGHGTTWHDLNKVHWRQWPERLQSEIDAMKKKCSKIFLCALSMGGGNSLYEIGRAHV